MPSSIYKLLDRPILYKIAQFAFAPGALTMILYQIRRYLRSLPAAEKILDVGCGPASLLFRAGVRPIGTDISMAYLREYSRTEPKAVLSSADALPFASGCINGVWSIGLLHHLPDAQAGKAIEECVRICSQNGYVVILDAVLPRSVWTRPLAALIRKLDRGKYMRAQKELEALFPDQEKWKFERFTYCLTGQEMLACSCLRL